MKDTFQTLHFPFSEWLKAFQCYFEHSHNDVIFILSEHWATAGYWIEHKDNLITPTDTVYRTEHEVKELYKRVRKHIEFAHYHMIPPGLIK